MLKSAAIIAEHDVDIDAQLTDFAIDSSEPARFIAHCLILLSAVIVARL
jgi:hypothetical protein